MFRIGFFPTIRRTSWMILARHEIPMLQAVMPQNRLAHLRQVDGARLGARGGDLDERAQGNHDGDDEAQRVDRQPRAGALDASTTAATGSRTRGPRRPAGSTRIGQYSQE